MDGVVINPKNKTSETKMDLAYRLFFRLYQYANMLHKTGTRAVEEEGLTTQQWAVLGMPLVESGCAAWLECRLVREPHTEDAYDTCFAEVVAAAADARIFASDHWLFRDQNVGLQTIHHLGAGNFVHAGGVLRAQAL